MQPSRMQQAVYEYVTDVSVSIKNAAKTHNLNPSTLHRVVVRWRQANPTVTLQSPTDVITPSSDSGRPRLFDEVEEELLAKTVTRCADDGWPLTIQLLQQMAAWFIERFCAAGRHTKLKHGIPSRGWVRNFIVRRTELRTVALRFIEDKRSAAITQARVAEHIARVTAVLHRYRIHDPRHIFNIDECGISFDKMNKRSLRRGVVQTEVSNTVHVSTIRTRGNLNHVTVMAVVAADGKEYNPVVVFPGKLPNYRRLEDNTIQTVHSFLPACYFYQSDPAGVDTAIFLSWAVQFLDETKHLRENDQHLVLILAHGYGSHIQHNVLQLLHDNRVHAIALPSHTSHVLQPLDVSVFSPFKSALQAEMHKVARHTRCIDSFVAASCITAAYHSALTPLNIMRGFSATGIWVREEGGTSVKPLTKLFRRDGHKVTVDELLQSLTKSTRALVFDANVMERGTVRINTETGAHLTSDIVIGALALREQRHQKARAPSGPSPFLRRAGEQCRRRQEQGGDDVPQAQYQPLGDAVDASRPLRGAIRKKRATDARGNNLV